MDVNDARSAQAPMQDSNQNSPQASARVLQGRETRDRLLEAARHAFGEDGYSATSVDDIVQRASVTKGAFYHHFGGKKEIFTRVFEQVRRELSRAAFVTHIAHEPFRSRGEQSRELQRFVEQTNEEVWEQLLARCRLFVDMHMDPAIRRIVLVDARWVLGWAERQAIEEEQGTVLIRADLRRLRVRGIVRPLPPHPLAVLLKGALDEACMLAAGAELREEAIDQAMQVIQAFLEGTRVPPRPPRKVRR